MRKFILLLISIYFFMLVSGAGQFLYAECECGQNGVAAVSEYNNGILKDIYGKTVSFKKMPERVVSLVPAITEMIDAVSPEYILKGITNFDSGRKTAGKAAIVGGFYDPNIDRIKELKPDMIFVSTLQKKVRESYKNTNTLLVILDSHNAEDVYKNIEIIGRIFHNEKNAKKTILGIKAKIENIQIKLSTVPKEKRLRVMRLMGFDGNTLGTPGDDSFQSEAIRLAGGIPIKTGHTGQITHIDGKEWNKYNPQAVYSCGDSEMWSILSKEKAWSSVDAVKNNRHLVFNCDLTCRASVNYGAFIEALSSALYGEYFFSSPPVRKDGSYDEKKIKIDIPYILSGSIKSGIIDDFDHKTLVIKLKNKIEVLSTLTGIKKADTIGNHYISPPRWHDSHSATVEVLEKKICKAIDADCSSSAFLITGADMDNLAVVKKEYKALNVYALVTAGVKSNAQRKSRDEGLYYPYGTINMIILSNVHLTQGTMAGAIISATEAKTTALQDLDIRSSYTGLVNQATGTGTDNIIVISGEGRDADSAGGHTKIGELIAQAAYEGVIKAVEMQNGILGARSVFKRLEERNISIAQIASFAAVEAGLKPAPTNKLSNASDRSVEITACMENAILDPEVTGFLESAFAISDAASRNLVSNDSLFNKWCLEITEKIAGRKVNKLIPVYIGGRESTPLNKALSAILTGAVTKIKN